MLDAVEGGFEAVGALIEQARFKAALAEVMRLATRVNQYISEQEPWAVDQADRERAGTVLYVALPLHRQPEGALHAVPALHVAGAP